MFDKPRILTLCFMHRIDVLMLHKATGLAPLLIWDMLRGVAVRKQNLYMALHGINGLAHTHYTIDDVHACVLEEPE